MELNVLDVSTSNMGLCRSKIEREKEMIWSLVLEHIAITTPTQKSVKILFFFFFKGDRRSSNGLHAMVFLLQAFIRIFSWRQLIKQFPRN